MKNSFKLQGLEGKYNYTSWDHNFGPKQYTLSRILQEYVPVGLKFGC